MAELELLRADIALVLLAHRHGERDALADRDTVPRERVELLRIVAHQSHGRDFQDAQDRGGGIVFARVVG
ncbi:hypothetical protein X989_5717 [Burkholderia pseudomallei MSHR4378]|nr:hypothetical protein X989_5717 [Burkholderia pseudomallei MSHR4378]